MTPRLRKCALTVHVTSSVGWLGAVAGFLALAVAGLSSHDWGLAKLLIPVLATILLLVHMQPVGHLARVVAEATLARGDQAGLRVQLVAEAGAALLAATALAVYKPRGMTPYGQGKRHELESGNAFGVGRG